ncbi:hypothetical protein V866_004903 [Kwoniella sp. B9012]
MATITFPSDFAPNKLTELHNMVWSIPNISNRDPALSPQQGCKHTLNDQQGSLPMNRSRRSIYLNAVRVIDLGRYVSYPSPTKWIRYFGPFPNARSVRGHVSSSTSSRAWTFQGKDPSVLFRSSVNGEHWYTFHERLRSDLTWDIAQPLDIPKTSTKIPKAWIYKQCIAIDMSDSTSSTIPVAKDRIRASLLDKARSGGIVITSLVLRPQFFSECVLDICEEVDTEGLFQLETLKIFDMDEASRQIIHRFAPDLVTLCIDLDNDAEDPMALNRILGLIDWKRFMNLKSLTIRCSADLHIVQDSSLPVAPSRLALPGQSLEWLAIDQYLPVCQSITEPYNDRCLLTVQHALSGLSTLFGTDLNTHCTISVLCLPRKLCHFSFDLPVKEDFHNKIDRLVKARESARIVFERRFKASPSNRSD